jgi:hypothetical protein
MARLTRASPSSRANTSLFLTKQVVEGDDHDTAHESPRVMRRLPFLGDGAMS